MVIGSSTVNMQSNTYQVSGRFVQEQMSLRLGKNATAATQQGAGQLAQDTGTARGGSARSPEVGRTVAGKKDNSGVPESVDLKPQLQDKGRAKVEKIVERAMLGEEVSRRIDQLLHPERVADDDEDNGNRGMAFVYDYQYREIEYEAEAIEFAANGVVRTADGQRIRFNVQLSMSREYFRETGFDIHIENGQMTDPLVLSVDAPAAKLTEGSFEFDLDADGEMESVPGLAKGQGFLALDRNGDGVINDGTELFGPQSGNGFGELSELDSDGNGWIDEADAAYSRLVLWRPEITEGAELAEDARSGSHGEMRSLKSAQVGAIYLGNTDTQFTLKGNENRTLGEISKSGIFLKENGDAGIIQHVNVMA